jgi:transcriptional regulator with XRE-family HTH domain
MENFFASNLKFLRKHKEISHDELAVLLNIKSSILSSFEHKREQPDVNTLIIVSNYFKVSIDTLLKIDLSELSEFQLSEIERGNDVYIRGTHLRILTITADKNNNDNIELVNEKAKAGYTTGYADPEYISDLPRYQLPFLSSNRKFRTFQVSGDSMLPIPDGSWVTGEFVHDWHHIISGKPYIVVTLNDGVVFKIADNLIQDAGKLRLYSLNQIFEPFDVPITEVREVWRFVHFISAEIPEFTTDTLTKTLDELKRDMGHLK